MTENQPRTAASEAAMFGRATGSLLVVLVSVLLAASTGKAAMQHGAEAALPIQPDFSPSVDAQMDPLGWEEELEAVHAPLLEEFLVTARVVDGSGRPVEGAVVVTTVGGQGVSDADGLVRMRVRMDPVAERLHMTAYHTAGTVTWTGSAIADATGGVVDAGEIPVVMRSGCEAGWAPTFGSGTIGNGSVHSAVVFDDGSGPKIYVGGDFKKAGGGPVSGLAAWDGRSWAPVSHDWLLTPANVVDKLFVLDSGTGPALYAIGSFQIGSQHFRIGRWDGNEWSKFEMPSSTVFEAFAYFDDGDGLKLYAGGGWGSGASFTRLMAWDGSAWDPVPIQSQQGRIRAMAVYDSGNGPELYIAGDFSSLNGLPVNHIAKWDGALWSEVGGGVDHESPLTARVSALTVADIGTGPKLYAAGRFARAGGVDSHLIAAWNGQSWESMGTDLQLQTGGSYILVITTVTMDGDSVLAVGGGFSSRTGPSIANLALWNGDSWARTQSLNPGPVTAICQHLGGAVDGLYVAALGFSMLVDGPPFASLHEGEWNHVGGGMDHRITSLAVFDAGSGPELYAGVLPVSPEDGAVRRWNGSSWERFGGPFATHMHPPVLTVFDDGSGDALYVGGSFGAPSGYARNVAKWDGEQFSYLPGPNVPNVLSFESFDNGSGQALYIGTDQGIRRWDGNTLSDFFQSGRIKAMKSFDDGSGPKLYVGGFFTSHLPNGSSSNIVLWDGEEWRGMGGGLSDRVHSIEVFDDGSGPAIFVGGNFRRAVNGPDSSGVIKWDGQEWRPLENDIPHALVPTLVRTLAVFDDGGGPALYAGGIFNTAGTQTANFVARWQGEDWSPLTPQIPWTWSFYGASDTWAMRDFAVFDDGSGPGLVMGGRFYLPATGEQNAARWQGCPTACIADINGDGVIDADDFFEFLSLFAAGDMQADINNDGIIDADDFFEFLTLFAAGC